MPAPDLDMFKEGAPPGRAPLVKVTGNPVASGSETSRGTGLSAKAGEKLPDAPDPARKLTLKSSLVPLGKLLPVDRAMASPNRPAPAWFVFTKIVADEASAPALHPVKVARAGSKLRLKLSPFSLP